MLLLADLYEHDIIKYGKFTLKSGKESDYYVDIKSAISHPMLMKKITLEFLELVCHLGHDPDVCICGVPQGAVPFAAALSYETGIPLIMIRKDVKDYGTQKQIEGVYNENTKVILIEDVVTSGSSMLEAAQLLKRNNLQVIEILSIVNRSSVNISFDSAQLKSLLHINHAPSINMCNGFIKTKGKLCVAADVNTSKQLIELIHKVGPHISILKTHIDIISDFTNDLIYELISLKRQYKFLIWEDRKFADIGNVVSSQIHGGIYKISSWADLVSMHLISGPGILKEAGPCGIIMIGSMSSKGSLADKNYLNKALQIANNKNIIGIVTQFDCCFSGIKIIPGVNILQSTDNKDQQYSALSSKSWGNLFVVGRDITINKDPSQRCIDYNRQISTLNK